MVANPARVVSGLPRCRKDRLVTDLAGKGRNACLNVGWHMGCCGGRRFADSFVKTNDEWWDGGAKEKRVGLTLTHSLNIHYILQLNLGHASESPLPVLFLQCIMAPVLERAIALTTRVGFGLLLLRQVAFTVRNHASHMVDVLAGILSWLTRRIVFKDFDDSATAMSRLLSLELLDATRSLGLPFMANSLSRLVAPSR